MYILRGKIQRNYNFITLTGAGDDSPFHRDYCTKSGTFGVSPVAYVTDTFFHERIFSVVV
jgi:hypothetical protein